MGNFRFGASSNVQPGVPYFPVAAAGPGLHRSFAIATESDALLHQAFTAAAAECSSSSGGSGAGIFEAAEQQLHQVLLQHWAPLQAAALEVEAAAAETPQTLNNHKPHTARSSHLGFRYLGLDSSLAPGLDTPPLTSSYEALGCCWRFGGAGSLAISAVITKVLKGLPLRLTGYCGLMLAVCEDEVRRVSADGVDVSTVVLRLHAPASMAQQSLK
jgi:uncharacterized protein (UPF0210 family)